MLWNNKLLKNINYYIPITVILLLLVGLLAISSAVEVNKPNSGGIIYLQKQIAAIFIGIVVAVLLQFYDYKVFKNYSNIFYGITLILLVYILFAAETVAGGKRWLMLGPIHFQPSEVAKILLILVLASILDRKNEDLKYLSGFIVPFLYLLIPFGLIILQNDLGTALVLLVIFIVMLYVAGANRKFMLIIFGGTLGILLILLFLHMVFEVPFPFLQEHQINRLIVFINPQVDPRGISYNLIQSKIALGSGKFHGKGLFSGTQNQLNFLPEKHTDFIFSVIGEEFGFLGVGLLIILFLILLWQLIKVAREAKDRFGSLVVTGIVAMFFFHIFENIGMTMGIMPITGIPLPFISYGGSSIVTSILAIGLVINIDIRKKKIKF
ncbi:MAG: rod shape-determining protein RodA [Bacillota bacterium]